MNVRGAIMTGAAVALAAAVAGCESSQKVVNQPAATSATSAGSAASGASSTTAAAKTSGVAHVGATLNVTGYTGSGVSAAVQLVQVINPAQGSDQFSTPSAGDQFVGVELKITNTGKSAYSATPDTDITILDSAGHSFSLSFGSLTGCTAWASPLTITPGQLVDGCTTFQVPVGDTITKVQFTPSAGLANDTAVWLVP